MRILGIGGTTRPGSSTELLVKAALDACAALGAHTDMFGGAQLAELPFYAPETPVRTPGQAAFVDLVRRADGYIIGSPGYHGGVSAMVKNAIDLIDDTRTDARVYVDGCPVGLIVSAAGWQATGVTLSSLRDIACALRGWPTPVGVGVNSLAQKPFDATGAWIDAGIRSAVEAQARQVVEFCQLREAARAGS